MTCIVGLVDESGVYIGGDSAGVAGLSLTVRADDKVFRNGECVMGFTSSFRMGQLLRYKFSPPLRDPKKDLFAYMVTDFVDAVRRCLKDGGYARERSGEESGGTFLVGIEDRLFSIQSDFQVGESADAYDAVGCGEELALGALHATPNMDPTQRVTMALSAAERFSAGVCGPFVIERLQRSNA